MKFYPKSLKPLGIASAVLLCVSASGLILTLLQIGGDVAVALSITGALLGILALLVYFSERSRYIELADGYVTLPRGGDMITDGAAKLIWSRTKIKLTDIVSVRKELLKGDKAITADTLRYVFVTSDGVEYAQMMQSFSEAVRASIDQELESRSVTIN